MPPWMLAGAMPGWDAARRDRLPGGYNPLIQPELPQVEWLHVGTVAAAAAVVATGQASGLPAVVAQAIEGGAIAVVGVIAQAPLEVLVKDRSTAIAAVIFLQILISLVVGLIRRAPDHSFPLVGGGRGASSRRSS